MRDWYVADFETTTLSYYNENGYTKVWLWAVANSNAEIDAYGETIDEFMEWCFQHPRVDVYFHNLKFDGSFIMHYLLTHQYEHIKAHPNKIQKTYDTLISEDGLWYNITINFSTRHTIKIYDSAKIIPLKVKEIAKAFKLPIEKEIIDYDKYEVNDTTLSYVFKDVEIVAMALKYFKDRGFNRMTIGSIAYNECKNSIKYFDKWFPKLDREWCIEWRAAYRGGRTQVNPNYAGKIVNNVHRYDINSMYPYVISRMPMPYGEPIEVSSPGQSKFELYKVEISFSLKEGHMPTLLKSSSMYNKIGDTYYIETDGVEVLYITSPDMMLLQRHYNIYFLKYVKIYAFETTDQIFRDVIDKFYVLKSNSTGGLKLLWKLILNNIYGKFGSKPKGANKYPMLDEQGILGYIITEDHDMPLYYLGVAMAVTSWAHVLIDNAICEVGVENFIYCDTDSVHTTATLPSEYIDNKELGKFKYEGLEIKSKYIRQKCYCYTEVYTDDTGKEQLKYTITCAGMTDSIKEYLIKTYNDKVFEVFDIGLKIDETIEGITLEDLKLKPKQVPGGVILVPTPFSLL